MIKVILEGKEKVEVFSTKNENSIIIDSQAIDKIEQSGILNIKNLNPEEIIQKCDEWLEKFKEIHDKFKTLVFTKPYLNDRITMHLNFTAYLSRYLDGKDKLGLIIKLYLDFFKRYGVFDKGIEAIANFSHVQKIIYEYLVANTLIYFIEKNYKNIEIEYDGNYLIPEFDFLPTKVPPIIASVGFLTSNYKSLLDQIIEHHNQGIPYNNIIKEIKKEIYKLQPVDENEIEEIFGDAEEQHKRILKLHPKNK